MNDGQRDAMLVEVHTDVGWIKEKMAALPCEAQRERIHAMEMNVRGLKNGETRRRGLSAGLGFAGAALAWIVERFVMRG